MPPSAFSDLPVEITQWCAEYIDPEDLPSFRLSCRQADLQTFDLFARRKGFSTWRTALMGPDLQLLESTSKHRNLAKYVTVLQIADDAHRAHEKYVWPRDTASFVQTHKIGLASLKQMLRDGRLRPQKIEIYDVRLIEAPPGPWYCTAMVTELLAGLDPAILSFSIAHQQHRLVVATIELAPELQGQGVGLQKLRSAELTLADGLDPCWPTRILHHAPALETVKIRCAYTGQPIASLDDFLVAGETVPKLREFQLMDAKVSPESLYAVLGNSSASLSKLTLINVSLPVPSSWDVALRQIADQCTGLDTFHIDRLAVKELRLAFRLSRDPPASWQGSAYFMKPLFTDVLHGVQYNGSDVKEVLKQVAASIYEVS